MQPATPSEPRTSRRTLGLSTAAALVIASMIGTGVFTTSGFLLADIGSPWAVLGVWLAGGVVATLGALSYGALARRIPESGGEYIFLARTVHPSAGYVAGWISLLAGFSAPLAAAAFGLGEYTKSWFKGVPPTLTGSIAILLFAFIHAAHMQRGATLQNCAVLLKLVLIMVLIVFGLSKISPGPEAMNVTRSPSAFAVALVWVSFSYSGWNAAIYIGGEVADPERNLPRALLLGALTVTLLYVGLNAVFMFSAPIDALAGKLDIGRVAAEALGGRALAEAVTALIALALITSISSMLMAGPRVYARMAADGYLPHWLANSSGAPRAAIGLQAFLALAMLWTAAYDALLTYIGFTLGMSTAVTVLGLVRLRLREKEAFPVPGWPWVPALFLMAVAWITVFSIVRRPTESMLGFATIAAGWAVWFAKNQRSHRTD